MRNFTRDAEVAIQVPPTQPLRAIPIPCKTFTAPFDPAEYGPEYLPLAEGNSVELVSPPAPGEGWAYGRLIDQEGGDVRQDGFLLRT